LKHEHKAAKGQKRSSREAKKPKQLKSRSRAKSSSMESSMQKIAGSLSRGSKTPLNRK
jgi:hypothetical protein